MIPVYQPYLKGREKEYVNRCLDSNWISSHGEFISRFEQTFAAYIGATHATTVSNGTVALHVALTALGIKTGDEVIVPTLTYIASVNMVLQTGANVVYADSLKDSWNIDPEDIRRKITPRTKAIMAVHLYGLACDMDAIKAIAQEYNLLLIEDCAEAFGTKYKGRHVGNFGDAATFSFFGNKTITTGEGGMVVMRDKAAHERVCSLKSQGNSKTREYWHDTLAYNYRMTNIQAAIGLAQLEFADDIIAKKREIALWYKQGITGLPATMQPELPDCVHSYWMCSILLESGEARNALREYLKKGGVDTRPLFYPSHTIPHCAAPGDFPVADYLSARGINLPSYPALEEKDVQGICNLIREFFNHQGNV